MQGGCGRNRYYFAGLSMNGRATPLKQSYGIVSHVFLIVNGGDYLPSSPEKRPAAIVEIVGMMRMTEQNGVELGNCVRFQSRTLLAGGADEGRAKAIVTLAFVKNWIGKEPHRADFEQHASRRNVGNENVHHYPAVRLGSAQINTVNAAPPQTRISIEGHPGTSIPIMNAYLHAGRLS